MFVDSYNIVQSFRASRKFSTVQPAAFSRCHRLYREHRDLFLPIWLPPVFYQMHVKAPRHRPINSLQCQFHVYQILWSAVDLVIVRVCLFHFEWLHGFPEHSVSFWSFWSPSDSFRQSVKIRPSPFFRHSADILTVVVFRVDFLLYPVSSSIQREIQVDLS
jgi:hypothetical protein